MALHDDKPQEKLTRLQNQLAKVKSLRVDNAIRMLAGSSDGREFLWWLLQTGKVGTQPFTSNALTTAFQCGELNVGQQTLDRILSVEPAVYVRMQQEQQADYDRAVNTNRNADSTVGPADSDDTADHPGQYDHPDLRN